MFVFFHQDIDDCGTTFRTCFCNLITTFLLLCSRCFIWVVGILDTALNSFFALSFVDTNWHEYRSKTCTVYFYILLYWNLIYVTVNSKFSFPRCSCVHCVIHLTHPCVLFAVPMWLPRSTALSFMACLM